MNKKDAIGITIIALVAVAFSAAAIIAGKLTHEPKSIDETTGCNTNRSYDHTIVLIDKTDKIQKEHVKRIRDIVLGIQKELRQWDRLTLFALDGVNYVAPTPIFSLCSPGQDEDANLLYQNPNMYQKQFNERFSEPLERTLDSLMKSETARISPIMEMINRVSRSDIFTSGGGNLKMVIISDLMQNMDKYSHYSINSNKKTNKKDISDYFSGLPESYSNESFRRLSGVELDVVYIRRKGGKERLIQGGQHLEFWKRYLEKSGGLLKGITVLEP